MWTYHAFPFAFAEPGYEAREIEPIAHEDELLRGLSIRLPEGVHSHSREQRFCIFRTNLRNAPEH